VTGCAAPILLKAELAAMHMVLRTGELSFPARPVDILL
jgi:hypothetical protein